MDFEDISHTESDFDVEMSSLSSTYVPTDGRGKRTPMRPMIAEYDPKRHETKTELSDMVLVKHPHIRGRNTSSFNNGMLHT
ncbi:hypothetical protein KQX54_009616 [Cotesia glomerata]|uniref:Uncharacterized protein n=1 Tax=Cotesia glomerata TaxID=32391 RepID=A0AAV7HIE3_COTGL|nr:hypothetical protein KQX54_009616 [Cotesia glomerata]